MLISEMPCDVERCTGVTHAAEEGDPLTAYFDAARGAFSPNTERALRADVEIFAGWCRRHVRVAVPASAATVVAFIDDRARVKAPATVRRYVSSIATCTGRSGRRIRWSTPASGSPCNGCTGAGGAGRRKSRD